ncbi:hypothetical protein BC332_14338 [Capsicum chinense]|nr:hypothetical protein BC332_14338 [Capsicum chinense]
MGVSGATSTSSNLIPSQAIPSASKSRTIQRKLQLRIEEQGKYLEMMFERTKDIGKDFKVSSSITDEHPSPSTEPKHSPPNDKSEALEKDPVSLNDRSITGQESS